MDKQAGSRNWKCFIGMHQWRVIKNKEITVCRSSDALPVEKLDVYILACTRCGKMTKRIFRYG